MSEVALAAVDLGASSGRVMLGRVGPDTLELTEVNRFRNGGVRLPDGLYWDVLGLYQDILAGLRTAVRQAGEHHGGGLAGLAIDTWGVDYGLLDRRGALLGTPRHYRDARTAAVVDKVHQQIDPARLYAVSGLQVISINTIYQLAAEPDLQHAARALMIPDLLGYWLTGRQAQGSDQLRRPATGAGVEQARGGGDRLLGGLPPREPVAEQVRGQQEAVRVLQVGLGRQLVDGVDRDDLQAVDGVEPGRLDLLVHLLDRRLAARVAVGVRVAAQPTVRVEQAVVHAPRVDRETGQHVGLAHGSSQAGEDVLVQPQHVPVDAVGQPDRAVAEPVDLGQLEGVGSDAAEHDPAAGRPEVDRGEGEIGVHRRNAAATPESTGMCSPVVWDRSPPVRANTASATCSGRTSLPSRVRLA